LKTGSKRSGEITKINNLIIIIMKTSKRSTTDQSILFKNMTILKQIQLVVFVGLIFTIVSCDKDDEKDPNVTFVATINGVSEVPANGSEASGTATLTFNTDTKIFVIEVTFAGVVATAAHIHKGAVGVSGGVEFGFTNPITSPINYTSVALDAAQEADLNAELYYVNIHSEEFPGGEIRGQLVKQ
jgi:hypothetical protein